MTFHTNLRFLHILKPGGFISKKGDQACTRYSTWAPNMSFYKGKNTSDLMPEKADPNPCSLILAFRGVLVCPLRI